MRQTTHQRNLERLRVLLNARFAGQSFRITEGPATGKKVEFVNMVFVEGNIEMLAKDIAGRQYQLTVNQVAVIKTQPCVKDSKTAG